MRNFVSLVFVMTFIFFSSLVIATPTLASHAATPSTRTHHVCSEARIGFAHCNAIQVEKSSLRGATPFAASPGGLNPADIQSAYNLPGASAGYGQTVGIVDAYDYPKAEADLAVYRAQFGLPECTTDNGCFRKVDQNGGTSYPTGNTGWSEEIALDLDMVSATCPNCSILLVEANSASFVNLGTAVNTAVNLGANTVSNSYGGSESSSTFLYASYYDHPGHIITVSSGDSGYGVESPASFNTVVSVGGTSLTADSSTSSGWSESAWSGAGSGCSRYISKPDWQSDGECSNRTIADVAAVADPKTGVSVYDTYGVSGWLVFGGTSVASPIIASVYALAGNSDSINAASSLYYNSDQLNDVSSGSNGSCGGSYLCTSYPGYDGPTGLGTPNGVGAF